jgi:hypothetical protein
MSKSGHFCKKLLFCKSFKNFFNEFRIRVKLGHISTFSNFEAKRPKNGSKKRKIFFNKHVLEFNYATINWLVHPSC